MNALLIATVVLFLALVANSLYNMFSLEQLKLDQEAMESRYRHNYRNMFYAGIQKIIIGQHDLSDRFSVCHDYNCLMIYVKDREGPNLVLFLTDKEKDFLDQLPESLDYEAGFNLIVDYVKRHGPIIDSYLQHVNDLIGPNHE